MDWLAEIEAIDREVEKFRSLNPAQLNMKPSPDGWSIAQQFDHLITINSSYFPAIESIREGKYSVPWHGKWPFLYNCMGRMILRSVEPDNRKKTRTFPIWEPRSSDIDDDILDRFLGHQAELRRIIGSCDDLVESGQVISSPANKNIVYSLEMAFTIIITHERRHLLAADALMEMV